MAGLHSRVTYSPLSDEDKQSYSAKFWEGERGGNEILMKKIEIDLRKDELAHHEHQYNLVQEELFLTPQDQEKRQRLQAAEKMKELNVKNAKIKLYEAEIDLLKAELLKPGNDGNKADLREMINTKDNQIKKLEQEITSLQASVHPPPPFSATPGKMLVGLYGYFLNHFFNFSRQTLSV